MYEELIKALRHCVLQNPCDGCPFYSGMDKQTEQCATMNLLAADAIEELSKSLDAVNDAHNEGYDVGYWAGRRDYEPKWIKFTKRPLDEEEQAEHPEWCYILDCPLPDDGDEVLVSDGVRVWTDIFNNEGDDGCYFDGGGDLEYLWWMPTPKPPKEET